MLMLESHTAPALSRLCGKDFGLNIFGPSSSGQILDIKFPHNFFFEETKTKMHLTIEFDSGIGRTWHSKLNHQTEMLSGVKE